MVPTFLSPMDGLMVGRKMFETGQFAAPAAASLAAAFTVYRNTDLSGALSALGLDTLSDSLPSRRWFSMFNISNEKSFDLSQAVPIIIAQLCGMNFPDVGETTLVTMAAGLAFAVASYLLGRSQETFPVFPVTVHTPVN